jgi:HD superfamily phosphohydrolase
VFVRYDSDERRIIDSRPFQRLRHIHQLALTPLVYPGATHKRFEHSLGVMELAGRVFDILTLPANVTDSIRDLIPEISQPDKLAYWRRVLRMAALCHDVGHLPFSHAAEKELLPDGLTHEDLTRKLIEHKEMADVWNSMTPPLRTSDIVKLAVGAKKARDLRLSNWEAILSEIIVGDAFGTDRMDYLLRDTYHAGVAYGRFDHYRLIDTLRILPSSPLGDSGSGDSSSTEPALGVQEGGLLTAEALLLARYFMYSQVYFHPIRRIYDIHLRDFMLRWLKDGKYPVDVEKHLSITDNEVYSELSIAANDVKHPGHDPARRIIRREHFRVLYQRYPADFEINPDAGRAIFEAATTQFGPDCVRYDRYSQRGGTPEFPVQARDGRIASSISMSETLSKLPVVKVEYVFIAPHLESDAAAWLKKHRGDLVKPPKEES